ncbi:LacI family DNA-binding transcriptional regulator [Paenibacillus chibensis]|uniref:LacI family DNA-binding transcriptional regulator n=1 Tax=Paenibacillus chibensis TaxID=59846 RepID=A0ABU6PTA0_9BACL|nr:LacI family DNA-binding transcriptional regulator [Paenibacillus chibensis]
MGVKSIVTNIKDVAKYLGISVSTVSRALNHYPDVSPITKNQVMDAVEHLNYRPNAVAKGLIQKKTFTVGLMIPDISDPICSLLAASVEKSFSDQGYQVVYGSTHRDPAKEKQFILNAISRQFDGLILTPDVLDEELVSLLSDLRMPVVFLQRRTPEGLNAPFVDVDHYHAASAAVRNLITRGHQRIGFIAMPASSFTGSERKRGYLDTMSAYGLMPEMMGMVEGGRTIEQGRTAMAELYQRCPGLTAVFAANDLLAVGALEWLHQQHMNVPGQISVIGFDNLEHAALHWTQLTTMEQPTEEMGRKCALAMLRMMRDPKQLPVSELIEAKLIERGSVLNLNAIPVYTMN